MGGARAAARTRRTPYRRAPPDGVGTAPVRTADGPAVAGSEVRVADGVRVREGTPVVRAVGAGAVPGADVRWDGPLARGRGLTLPGDDGVGSADGLLAGGGASGTTGDTGASGAADRSGSATRAPTAHATAAPAAARSSSAPGRAPADRLVTAGRW